MIADNRPHIRDLTQKICGTPFMRRGVVIGDMRRHQSSQTSLTVGEDNSGSGIRPGKGYGVRRGMQRTLLI